MMTEENKTNPKLHGPVIISLIMGIIGIALSPISTSLVFNGDIFDMIEFSFFGLLPSCLAIVFGYTTSAAIKNNSTTLKGKELAITSIVLGTLAVLQYGFLFLVIGLSGGITD